MIRRLNIYLPVDTMGVIDRNPNHFYGHVQRAFQGIGFAVVCAVATKASLKASFDPDVYCMFHRNTPIHTHAIEARPAPMGPFWMLDNTADPAQKRASKATFSPDKIDGELSDELAARFHEKFGQIDRPTDIQRGFVLIALQGALDRQRYWQTMSPIEMVRQTIAMVTDRQVFIKFHPGQTYTNEEVRAVHALADGDRVQVVNEDLNALLDTCAYTVSMNSTVSVKGLLFGKGGVLFGDADFHHPFQSVREHGVSTSFERVMTDEIYAGKYLLWYLRRQHIATYKVSVEQDILRRCANLGWELSK